MEEMKKEINLDSILDSLGPYGRYNLLNYVLLLFPVLLSSFFECGFIFEAQEQIYRCEVNGCEHFSDTSWQSYAIPMNEKLGKLESCKMYKPLNGSDFQCLRENFLNETILCDSYIYENNNSLVKEFSLGCEDWKRALVGTIHNCGMFVAMLFTGAVSDRFGRKVAVGFAAGSSLLFGFSRAFSPNYLTYVALHFLEAAFGGGLYPSAYVFIVELVGLKQRVFVSAMCNMTFVIGVVLIALLAWCIDNWRTYIMILYAPAVIVLVYIWFMNESARWLLSKGKREKAISVLKKAAKINNLDPRQLELESLGDPLLKAESQTTDKKSQFYKAVRSSIIWKRLIICSFLWMTCSLVYYGLSINSVSLSSNRYVSFMLVTLVEIPAYIVVVIVLDKYGRKRTLMTTFIICGITMLLFSFLPRSDYWSIPLYLLAKWAVTLSYSSVYIYVSEVFPTNMRQTLISMCSMAGRIGSLVAPLTPLLSLYHKSMPTVIFAGMASISSMLVLMLPETKNMRLPDTIEEAEALSKRRNKN
ncbi:unnamed protein product [Arctia plantaginis]|uniref:Major facilitator superfamily (MFS) profile domain-containing protein n=1 Tax=Arctia plantaginis TaxID=874455 RepID=A0A8S1AV48_ARCPL|nr:unnamed protein product [Arctia plantaginis]CAB3253847.1 unnamed protein product [Arctia plantaginis]